MVYGLATSGISRRNSKDFQCVTAVVSIFRMKHTMRLQGIKICDECLKGMVRNVEV